MDQDSLNSSFMLIHYDLERIFGLLTQIAATLERDSQLASNQKSEETMFPWDEVSCRTYRSIQQEVIDYGLMQKKWPLTCEDLVSIGEHKLLEIRNFGDKSLAEIRQKLRELGFEYF